jgi:GcrA cell cycle regulator
MTWTEERVEDLKRLWGAGHSASEIGEVIGVTKNAVIGKAHRLKLSSRPSPIHRSPTGTPKPKRTRLPRPMVQSKAAPAPAPVVRAVPLQLGNQSCLWPIGDPGDANFHFCGSAAVVAKPYCPEHCARAYITKTRQGSQAA